MSGKGFSAPGLMSGKVSIDLVRALPEFQPEGVW